MTKFPAWIKDIVALLLVFSLILGGLFLYTGVWPPAVIVESGSMMHRDEEVTYGRTWLTGGPGTIDPGDMVLVKAVDDARNDVQTLARGGKEHYASSGDVVIYYPGNNRERTPIIHRAVAWIELKTDSDTGARRYEVDWSADRPCPNTGEPPVARPSGPVCVFGPDGVTINEFGLFNYKPLRSGLVTKGDNPFTNTRADQASGLSDIVQPDWIQGKARGEIPWLGLIKLAISPQPNERTPPPAWVKVGSAYAPKDLWVMLGLSLFLLVALPIGYDAYKAMADRQKAKAAAGAAGAPGGAPGAPESGGDPSAGPPGTDEPPAETEPGKPPV